MVLDTERVHAARGLIAALQIRIELFPSEPFHDFGWHVLLIAFVANAMDERLTEAGLIETMGTSKAEVQRCLYWLGRDEQLLLRNAGEDITLTSIALDRLRAYIDRLASSGRDVAAAGLIDVG